MGNSLKKFSNSSFLLFLLLVDHHSLQAAVQPNTVYVADTKKTQAYIRDGLIIGGDQAINTVIVKNIRVSENGKFERIVIDLQGSLNGESAAIKRPPFYQLAVSPDEKRIVMTIWGKPKLDFNPNKVVAEFKKHHHSAIQDIELLPVLEDNLWTFDFHLKSNAMVEVFELNNPVRVIMDIERKRN